MFITRKSYKLLCHKVLVTYFILFYLFSPSLLANQTMTACGHHDYAPWNWQSNNKIIGVCAEIAQTLFKQQNIHIDLTYVGPWPRCLKNIEAQKVDINICSFINKNRQTYTDSTQNPMSKIEQAIFIARDKPFVFNQMQDLVNKRIAIVHGVSIGQEFDDFIKNNHNHTYQVSTYKQAFHMLKLGRIDAVPMARHSGRLLLKELKLNDEIVDLPTPLLTGNLYISMAKSPLSTAVLSKIEQALLKPEHDKWVKDLIAKYSKIYHAEKTSSISTQGK